MKVEFFEGKGGRWYWRLMTKNGRVMATSGESYTKRGNLQRAWDQFAAAVGLANVTVVDTRAKPKYTAIAEE